jgi:hypothetical protein
MVLDLTFALSTRGKSEANVESTTLANLPHPGSGGNRHGESIMIDWPLA